jgi:hypothetical protein
LQLSTHRAGTALELTCDLANPPSRTMQIGNEHSVILGKKPRRDLTVGAVATETAWAGIGNSDSSTIDLDPCQSSTPITTRSFIDSERATCLGITKTLFHQGTVLHPLSRKTPPPSRATASVKFFHYSPEFSQVLRSPLEFAFWSRVFVVTSRREALRRYLAGYLFGLTEIEPEMTPALAVAIFAFSEAGTMMPPYSSAVPLLANVPT